MSQRHKDLVGYRFGRWTVLRREGTDPQNYAKFACRCDCGTERLVVGRNLTNGASKSCGCLQRDSHDGHTKDPEWRKRYHRAYYNRRRLDPDHARNQKAKHLYRTFGITLGQYDAMFSAQGGVCAICGKPETVVDRRTGQARDLAVDHNHDTGRVRGLLCGRCNTKLPAVEHQRWLDNAKRYLDAHERGDHR